jgi:ABC-type amino acid transport substrate-binding protein
MAAIQAEGTMVIAVPADATPFAFSENGGEPQGFLVELGNQLAETLEVEAEYITSDSEEMYALVSGADPRLVGDQEADAAFPLVTITEETYKATSRELGFDVTTPYFVGHQRLLVPPGSSIESTKDLAGTTVCSLLDPVTGFDLSKTIEGAEILDVGTIPECAAALKKGTVDAATAVDLDLVRMLADLEERGATGFEIVGEQLTTQGYAPIVVRGMAGFASAVFNDARSDGRWVGAYEEWIGPLTKEEDVETPGLTLEEAAALFPMPAEGS